MDIIGPFVPPSSAGYRYILTAMDYFSKWAEAVALKDIKSTVVSEFIRTHIIYRFGIPESVIMDNGQWFKSDALNKLFAKYKIKNNHSSRYHALANGLAEAFNKTLCKILKKRTWHEKLQEALWAYRPSHRTPTQVTPYSLDFGGEAVLPLEVQIPSL
ncbi:protein NYNRIN-like [Camellia sinensis]|uniref:protein NYNRIN-like n=1 Tax=Camellia sinensis TaxID=4442 RepID=UPI001036DF4E|nr:protein NYNRIN-like [Camellia sinensis]